MFKKIKNFFSHMFGKDTQIYQRPLNTLSVIFVITFDIFLFYNIFSWYSYQKDLVVSPYEKYYCIEYFHYDEKRLLHSDQYALYNRNQNGFDVSTNRNLTVCNTLNKLVSKFTWSNDYKNFKNTYNTFNNELYQLENEKVRYEKQYQDFLQETQAGINDHNARLSDIDRENARINYQNILQNITAKNQEITLLEEKFMESNKDFQELSEFIFSKKEEVLKSYEKEIFFYPVKIALFQAILLLPLFMISLFFYNYFLKRHNKIFTILFSNLTFITGIFVFILFLKVVYFILPKKLLVWFITLLKSLSLWFLWNYILVGIGIVIFGFIIYLSQKAIEKYELIKKEQLELQIQQNRKKIQKERFEKKLCIECGAKLLPESMYCQECWYHQYDECKKCSSFIPKVFDFCHKCGTKK